MEVLRTPDERFSDLPEYPFEPHYAEIPDLDGGTLRMHYVDEGPREAGGRAVPTKLRGLGAARVRQQHGERYVQPGRRHRAPQLPHAQLVRPPRVEE